MKKVVIGIIVAIVIIVIGAGAYFMLNSENQESTDNANKNVLASNNERNVVKEENQETDLDTNEPNDKEADNNENEEASNSGNKTLVVYYSAQNHTKAVSEKIAEELDSDIFEIVPEDVYTSDDLNWTNSNSRVSKEHDDESLRNVKLEKDTVDNWDEYETVLIGYPIWWGIAAWPVDTFVKANNFEGKTVIPFCTSASSGLGESGKLLEKEANGGDWKDGQRFRENPSDNDIKDFVGSIK